MKVEALTGILKMYRVNKGRAEYLEQRIAEINADIEQCKTTVVSDQVSMSQAITGMPHGTTPGKPVEVLAVRLASGIVTGFLADLTRELEEAQTELSKVRSSIQTVEIVLSSLTEKERQMIELKMIDDQSWAEILPKFSRPGQRASKRTLQRLLSDALVKGAQIVR